MNGAYLAITMKGPRTMAAGQAMEPSRIRRTQVSILRIGLLSVTLTLGASCEPVASAQQASAPRALYDRLGGLKGITVVVDDFIDRLVANEELNKNPAIDAGRKRSPAPYLKFQVSQLVCGATGGPCKYTGKAMKESHVHLNISEREWEVMATEFGKSLEKFQVPAAERKELFDIVGMTKAEIVVTK
jgi:hemoglobin